MREGYVKELEELKIRMEKAEEFAKKLPVFSEKILAEKLTGEEDSWSFGNKYKDIPLYWGITRYRVKPITITNYEGKPYSGYIFCICINTYSLFDNHIFCVDEVAEKVELFFYDRLNSTFYCTDDQVEAVLEALNNWYKKCRAQNKKLLGENMTPYKGKYYERRTNSL